MTLKDTQNEGITTSLQEEEQASDITFLLSMADHPLRFLREGGKYKLRLLKRSFPLCCYTAFRRLCVQLVVKAEEVYQKGRALQNTNIQTAIDISDLLIEQHGRVPGIL